MGLARPSQAILGTELEGSVECFPGGIVGQVGYDAGRSRLAGHEIRLGAGAHTPVVIADELIR
jgi:hypothetical protein